MREALETWYGVGAMKEFRAQDGSFCLPMPKSCGIPSLGVAYGSVASLELCRSKLQLWLMELGLMERLRDCTKNIYIVLRIFKRSVVLAKIA